MTASHTNKFPISWILWFLVPKKASLKLMYLKTAVVVFTKCGNVINIGNIAMVDGYWIRNFSHRWVTTHVTHTTHHTPHIPCAHQSHNKLLKNVNFLNKFPKIEKILFYNLMFVIKKPPSLWLLKSIILSRNQQS